MPLKRASRMLVLVKRAPKGKRVVLVKSKQAQECFWHITCRQIFISSRCFRTHVHGEFAATHRTHETAQTDEEDYVPPDLPDIEKEAYQSERILRYPKSIKLK